MNEQRQYDNTITSSYTEFRAYRLQLTVRFENTLFSIPTLTLYASS